ncbi:MAG: hypothetical protein OXK77_18660 [Gemmatimonadota bacterium]|nr:hypothetical protein [Gemmatimonadota bacterium]MDE2784977.1 hypothetical protein [Gemmatimonadota bacterium]MDE2863735.1 hypothetical protein [Gemmatimonadota bacterium]MXV96358.1 hypothetical protein [Gemmatimonadota bacterium]MYB05087.1 hypothetical protein [Gemmatimonadota bacterium]
MNRTTESMVDILRRSGPGALPATRLLEELGRCHPPIRITVRELRLLVDETGGRLELLEISADGPGAATLDSWVVLMDPEDGPSRSRLAEMLWESLAAMAEALDPASRTDVARWMLQAEHAIRISISAARMGLDLAGPGYRRR